MTFRDSLMRKIMDYSISQLAKKHGLSRSALLYYESIGLLSSSRRTQGNYRVYTEEESRKLEQICLLRSTGVSLEIIKKIVNSAPSRTNALLRERLAAINGEINKLRRQQKSIVKFLGENELLRSSRIMTKEKWIEILSKAGLDEDGRDKWHSEFELSSPEAHQDFLESLGLSAQEIALIRKFSREGK